MFLAGLQRLRRNALDGLLLRNEPIESEAERARIAELRHRPRLTDSEFYDAFYRETGIAPAIPVSLRALLTRIVGDEGACLRPPDNIAMIFEGLDFADVLCRVGREFSVSVPLSAFLFPEASSIAPCPVDRIDGTFDSIVRYLDARTKAASFDSPP